MVVCVDGSGSMAGAKELWAKAVALALMEVARRERRRCLAIVFSSDEHLFEAELLAKPNARGGRRSVWSSEVMRFAEHFPGGGTSFEIPLRRAVDTVASGSYRRGGIVFITDGEADVSDSFLAELAAKKKKHRFTIRGVLIDAAGRRKSSMQRFCDAVRLVTELGSDSMKDFFEAF
jgi:uncharacterized protein with von Willebrand factor type A (vWA) domain